MHLKGGNNGDALFDLTLTTLKLETIRVRVTEISPLKLRYEAPVGDALVGEPVTVPLVFIIFVIVK